MAEVIINGLIEGGKATSGPPFGPALGPLGVNIAGIVNEINTKTKDFEGMKIPVKVIVDGTTKKFRIEVGNPPTSALILKEIGAPNGAKTKEETVGNITLEQVKKLSNAKSNLYGNTLADKAKQILGTCKSMGVTCEGVSAVEMIKKINSGEVKL
ncbi:MAG: 50S ribosomal protein L11 [Candidatus Marsarchaeota archaeon]|jgi:large subunit ribosomal protein L11|nr:50S ribosomal protein L11 [Candidatus Marsarchaeota archaeon]